MSYQAVLFDLDGTLIDTLEDLGNAVNRVLVQRGFPEHPLNAYRRFVGDGATMLITRALPKTEQNCDTISASLHAFREDYRRNWNVSTRLYAGVPEMLDALASRGLKMAALSNKPHEFTTLCVSKFLSEWTFDVVLGERDSVPRKPDPAGALEIAAHLKIPPADFLYLGDTDIDMKTATAAGMFAVGVLWGFRPARELQESGAQILIERPMDITDLLTSSSSRELTSLPQT